MQNSSQNGLFSLTGNVLWRLIGCAGFVSPTSIWMTDRDPLVLRRDLWFCCVNTDTKACSVLKLQQSVETVAVTLQPQHLLSSWTPHSQCILLGIWRMRLQQ